MKKVKWFTAVMVAVWIFIAVKGVSAEQKAVDTYLVHDIERVLIHLRRDYDLEYTLIYRDRERSQYIVDRIRSWSSPKPDGKVSLWLKDRASTWSSVTIEVIFVNDLLPADLAYGIAYGVLEMFDSRSFKLTIHTNSLDIFGGR